MTIKVLVMDEQPDSYDGKKGRVDQWKLLCLDWSEGHRCKTLLEFTLPKEQEQYKGAFKDRVVDLTVTEITNGFGGAMRVRGSVNVAVEAAPQSTGGSTGAGKKAA